MASEYSVNIKLNTQQVKKDLKTIGKEIENVGRTASGGGGKKRILSTKADDDFYNTLAIKTRKFARSINPILKQADKVAAKGGMLALPDTKMLNAQVKGIKRLETSADIAAKHAERKARAEERSAKFAVESMKANQASAKAGVAHARKLERMRGDTGFTAAQYGPQLPKLPIQGPRMGPTSMGLNFDPFTNKLLQGPAGSNINTFGNLGRRFDFQSALISGGFPLLFGQGPVGALAGGLGGGIGGMFGQMGGFAGGIVATAAVQSISNFTKAIGELGTVLSRPTENIGSLVEKLGLANDPAGRLALRLEKLGLTSSASALLMEKFTEQTGKSPDVLKNAAQEINEMNKSLATFGLKLQLLGAEVITPIVDALNKIPFGAIGNKIKPIANLLMFGQFEDPSETINKMKGISNIPASEGNAIIGGVPLNPDFGKTPAQIGKTSALEALASQTEFTRNILPLQQSLELEKQRFTLNSQQLSVKREANKLDLKSKELELLKSQAAIKTNQDLDLKIEKLTAEVDLQRQIFENAQILADPIKAQTIQLDQQMAVLLDRGSQIVALSQTISSSFEQSFKGIINGTMSVQDGFRNMLNSIANHFLNTAAKMMANQMQRSLLGFLGKSLFGGLFGGGGDVFAGFNAGPTDPNTLTMANFANGGRPRVGKTAIVGERGPELFTPGVTGTVTPNHALGGSTTVVVNVDASGSNVEGDEQQGRQLGLALSAAIESELIKQKRPGGLLA